MGKRARAVTATPEYYAAMIAVAAYYKAEQRGFAPGYEVSDWLEAEREFSADAAAKPDKASSKRKKSARNGD
jgi:hypothetical protein